VRYTKEYYVPVVVKNRDYLIGFLDAVSSFTEIFEIDFTALDSMRFTDILPNGQRRRDLTNQQILDVLSDVESTNRVVEKTKDVNEEVPFLEVNCQCGNYIAFNHPSELPSTTRTCELCGKVLIDYTGHDQDEYVYDGDLDKMLVGVMDESNDDDDDDDEDGLGSELE
jgi:ribosomal protein S27E